MGDEDGSVTARRIQRLLDLGAIARKSDVDSGAVVVPAESYIEPGEADGMRVLVAPERRPQTLLAKINRIRALDQQGRIENEKGPGGRPLLQREIQPWEGPNIVPELVPAAQRVNAS